MSKSGKLKFSTLSNPEIKLSDDRSTACRKIQIVESVNYFTFSDQSLCVKDDFQIQIIHMISSQGESLQFGVVSDPPLNLNKIILDKDISLKNSLSLRTNVLYHQNDENVITNEEYDLNLDELREGDLVGIRITEARELFFTCNGVAYRKAADNIPKNIWAFVNLNGRCSFISIVSYNSSITNSHREKSMRNLHDNIAVDIERNTCFHNYCGKEVILSDDNRVAKRKNPTNEFRNAVVISNSPLVTDEMFRLRIEGLINKWNGSIELGVTFHNPDMFELPTAMNNLRSGTLVLSGNSILTNGHGTRLPYCTTSLDDLKIGDEIGIVRKANGNVHFFINNDDLGVAGNIPVDKDLWVIADLYGRTIKISIVNDKLIPLTTDTCSDLIPNTENVEDCLVFHSSCGKNVKLSDDRMRASRINDQEFNNGVMFTHRPLKIGERWTVRLVRCVEQWAGNMELGLTTKCPDDCDIPCTMTDIITGYTIMLTSNGLVIDGSPLSQSCQILDSDDIHPILLSGIPNLSEGSTMSVELLENRKIQFYINEADLGIMSVENDSDQLYGVIDLYGKAAQVSIYTQGLHCTTQDSEELGKSFSSTINDDNPSELESASIYQSLLYSEENNDFGRSFSLLQSESGLCDALKEADRSFLRLLSGNTDLNRIPTNESNNQPLVFHHAHGRNVILTNDGRTAYRPSPYNEFKNALVMSSRPLETDEIFEICIDKMTDHWSGSLEMGVTLNNPVELNFPGTLSQLDKDCWILSGSCIMNNGITARNDYSLDMDAITVYTKIGLMRKRSGMLHFLLDGKDMGAAYFDVPPGIYAILDLYGQCSKVTITNRTGTRLSGEQSINLLLVETSTSSASVATAEPDLMMQSNDAFTVPVASSRLSPFDRVMLVFKENISGLSEDDGLNAVTRCLDLDLEEPHTSFDDDNGNAQLFTGDNIFGDGIRWNDSFGFRADNQKSNCVIQSKYPMKTNVYYEMIFYTSKDQYQNSYPISFGFTAEKFSSQKYLANDLFQLNPPNWILNGQKLFIDNRVHSLNFANELFKLKKKVLIAVYLQENNNLEIFVNRVKIGFLELNHNKKVYMLIDLKGWYDSVMMVDNILKVIGDPPLLDNTVQRPYSSSFIKKEFPSDEIVGKADGQTLTNELSNFSESLEIEDPLMISILKELYELLPVFMISLKGIETSRLVEKIVISNNDIVLNIKNDIENGKIQNSIERNTIRNLLIDELAKRLSRLGDLKYLGHSNWEIARVLRRQVHGHNSCYDGNARAFVVPGSCLHLEESRLSRTGGGCEFGMGIINQELKSEKYKAYEFHISHTNFECELANSNVSNNLSVGLILIESKHFRKPEEVLKFLSNIPSPKHVSSITNHVNLELDLFDNELPSLVLLVEDDSIFLNGHQISQKMPFNIGSVTTNQFLSFKIRESSTVFPDIFLSIRTIDSSSNHLILSQSLVNCWRDTTSVWSNNVDYFYIPFVWLNNGVSITITTGSNTMSQSLLGSNQANERDWLEKHYNDELNKETSQGLTNETVDSHERQCFSLKRASFVKTSLSLPESYFKNKSAICFCNSCRSSTLGSGNVPGDNCEVLIKGDPAKEFRLPLGWVKYNIRLKRESRYCLSQWNLAYLTVSPLLIHRLLSTSDPVSFLKCADLGLSSVMTWLTTYEGVPTTTNPKIIISPWQPLPGGYINEDKTINTVNDAELNYYDSCMRSETAAMVALEVRVKPHTYQSMEYKIVSENISDEKSIVVKEAIEGGIQKRSAELNAARSINPKTVWIINGEANSLVISGLLIKII